MKIAVLTENTTINDSFEAEHGLSLFIQTDNHNILFDMGQTDLFLKNAEKLGIDLACVDIAILSHGHYDHGGGLQKFLEINSHAPVYISRYAFGEHYNGCEKYIGLERSLQNNNRLIFTDGIYPIEKGLTLYHKNDEKKLFDLGSFGLNMKVQGEFLPDDFRHEQYLEIEEDGKRVIISGCSHKGILNIAKWFEADALIGGFHFSKLELDDTLKKYAQFLDGLGTEFYTCHCTGCEQFEFMKKYMRRLRYISTGEIIEIK